VTLEPLCCPAGYKRLWTPAITLWYFIWQWLQPRHTLEAVIADARRGGADGLCPRGRPLAKRLVSKSTAGFSKARGRLSPEWVRQCFVQLASLLARLAQPTAPDMAVQLIDGSTKRMRPQGDIPQQFPPHRTRRKTSYWCVGRLVVSYCAYTGLAMGALLASIHVSEQALAVQLMLEAAQRVLYIGDRNFGVWRVVRAAVQSGGHALVRLTQVRARKLLGKKRLPAFLDMPVLWTPTSHDQVDQGLEKLPVAGRLIILKTRRPGFRALTLYLFTTLTDPAAYPPERLLELYGLRWQAELNFRTVKATLQMDQSEAKSAAMVLKEFYAGLMGYNLVRGCMVLAAQEAGCQPSQLSFSKVHILLAQMLAEVFLTGISAPARLRRLVWMRAEASAARLPRRRKRRPNEPRAQYYEPQVFPKMRGSCAEERLALKQAHQES
jgi:hypothetical protein